MPVKGDNNQVGLSTPTPGWDIWLNFLDPTNHEAYQNTNCLFSQRPTAKQYYYESDQLMQVMQPWQYIYYEGRK